MTCLSGGGQCYNNSSKESKIRPIFQCDRRAVLVSLVFAAVSLAGCTYDRGMGPPQIHFAEFRVAPPDGDAVEVCHAYTCQMKSTFYFRSKDITDIAALMNKTKSADTPFEERRAIAYAIGLIESESWRQAWHQR